MQTMNLIYENFYVDQYTYPHLDPMPQDVLSPGG